MDAKEQIKELNDNDLFDLLECASDELKRRNGLLASNPAVDREKLNQVTLKMVMDALANLGEKTK